jgi:hypothetical protein
MIYWFVISPCSLAISIYSKAGSVRAKAASFHSIPKGITELETEHLYDVFPHWLVRKRQRIQKLGAAQDTLDCGADNVHLAFITIKRV